MVHGALLSGYNWPCIWCMGPDLVGITVPVQDAWGFHKEGEPAIQASIVSHITHVLNACVHLCIQYFQLLIPKSAHQVMTRYNST